MDIINIAILGTAASFLMEVIQNKWGTGTILSKAIITALSLVIGTFYFFASQTDWWVSFLGVLATASTVYAFFFKKEPVQN